MIIFGAFWTAFLLTTLLMPWFINKMHRWQKEGQPIRENGPQTHLSKKGTPTMGGVLVLFSILISCLIWGNLSNPYLWILLFVMTSFGLLGFQDDYLKIKKRSSNTGFSGRERLFAEFTLSAIAIYVALCFLPPDFSTAVEIPLFHIWLPLGVFYVAFGAFILAGTTNAVNLTDGLDGLVSVPLMIGFFCFGTMAFISNDWSLCHTCIPDLMSLCVFASACIGALGGFLIFNHKPAEIFLGDVGALGLGGSLGMMALLTKQEVLLGIVGALFVIEALSDIIQVGVYKRTKKRVFLMAPIHHHFEKKGWSEKKVVRVFWAFALFSGILGLIIGIL